MTNIIEEIDKEIGRLQQARRLLSSQSTSLRTAPKGASSKVAKRGRPKGSKNGTVGKTGTTQTPEKRTMSAEGRAKIASAQKKRWAEKNKAAQ